MSAAPAYPHEAPPAGPSAALAAKLCALVPRLDTKRLVLRAPRVGDFDAYAEIMMSDRARYMDGPFDRREAWLDFTQCLANWLLRGHGLWTIEEKAGGAVLGFVLVCLEYGDQEPELGFFLREKAEGRGIAFEAAKTARDHALDTLQLPSLVSYVDPGNARSARLAERLGARRDDAAAAAFGEPILVYRHAPQVHQ